MEKVSILVVMFPTSSDVVVNFRVPHREGGEGFGQTYRAHDGRLPVELSNAQSQSMSSKIFASLRRSLVRIPDRWGFSG